MGANGVLLKGALIKEGRLYNNFRIKGGAYYREGAYYSKYGISIDDIYEIGIELV